MEIEKCHVQTNLIKKELKEQGTPAFPVGFYQVYLPTDDVPWHWHEQLELVFVEKGRLYLGANSDKVRVEEGEGFFINKEILHSYWCEDGDSCTFNSILFKAELLGGQDSVFYQNYLRHLVENNEYPYMLFSKSGKWQEEILRLRRRIWDEAVKEEFGYEFSIRSDLSKIMLTMLRHMPGKPTELTEKAMRTERRMKAMLNYIAESCGEDIKLEDIARSAAISESECVRCFREALGISPIRYVKKLRIQRAAELLLETSRPVSAVAEQCGFQDMSYFTRSFREMNGVTPSEFRKNGKKYPQ